jgi:hypothetical protein
MTFKEAVMKDLKEVLSTPAGKRIIGEILKCSLLSEGSYIAGSFDATAYREGIRYIGLMTANSIREIDPCLIGECEKAYEEQRKLFEEAENYEME